MNKSLLLSLVTSSILIGTSLSADTMYDRFETMEAKMQKIQKELAELKAKQSVSDEEAEDKDATSDDEEVEEKVVAKKDSGDGDSEEEDDEEDSVQDQLDEIQENLTELNKATNGSHLKFGVDYRFALENLNYKMANDDEHTNDAFMTNRFWLNMDWAATKNLSFHGQIAYNKAFGERAGNTPSEYPFESFDWITNENAYDDKLRIKNAYFLYVDDKLAGADIPWTFSIGRRPSTNGHLINLRDDDHAASPQGHSINVEFDGLSAKFGLENLIGINGMYIKFCAGRGMSNASAKMDFGGAPYADGETRLANIDLAGFILRAYSNGQYTIDTQYYFANNLIDINGTTNPVFETVGNLQSVTASFMSNGIGEGLGDYLDDTTFFISGAMSITDPDNGKSMLGRDSSRKGYSIWTGVQMPSLFTSDGKWGIEYNHGTKYWRSITYAEDTNIGSKVAARGDAYEAYFTEYLVEDILSIQLRYTYIDYAYSGSNGFFGSVTGNSMKISDIQAAANAGDAMAQAYAAAIVDKAQDIRFYIRYRY
ncbi:DUF3373 family protein [Sulfurimonas sp.]|uniref:DUF3373 family protein n=1 Tax=Sulfurimonas sp. TaxID=2022749 RepID=UPI003D0E0AE3